MKPCRHLHRRSRNGGHCGGTLKQVRGEGKECGQGETCHHRRKWRGENNLKVCCIARRESGKGRCGMGLASRLVVIPVIGGIEWTGEEGGLESVIRMNYRREEMHGRRECEYE